MRMPHGLWGMCASTRPAKRPGVRHVASPLRTVTQTPKLTPKLGNPQSSETLRAQNAVVGFGLRDQNPRAPSPGPQITHHVVEIIHMTTHSEDASEVFEVLRLALAEQAITLAQDEQRVDERLDTYLERTATR